MSENDNLLIVILAELNRVIFYGQKLYYELISLCIMTPSYSISAIL